MAQGAELLLRSGVQLNLEQLAARSWAGRLWVRAEGLDAITAAAAIASHRSGPIGVVLGLDREPSVLARDLTTLTHLCPAGLAVALRPGGEAGRLGEYVAVLRAMFTSEETTLAVGASRLEATPNRPLPAQPGGPEIWIDGRTGSGPVPGADGLIAEGDLAELEA